MLIKTRTKISIDFVFVIKDRQDLELHFYNVQLLNFIGIYVMNTLKLKAVNVKEARFWNSTFAHIPVGGFEVSRAKLLNIKVIYLWLKSGAGVGKFFV